MTQSTERHVHIACERGQGGIAQRSYEVGAFAAVAGIRCRVTVPDLWSGPGQVIKVTVEDVPAYTALRIQFGHHFVTETVPKTPTVPHPVTTKKPRSMPKDWTDILREADYWSDSSEGRKRRALREVIIRRYAKGTLAITSE